MKKAHFEFEEIPFSTLARFGLTQEMIEDLPMHVLDDIYNGRHSPVLPVRVTDEHGETVESRTRCCDSDTMFYAVPDRQKGRFPIQFASVLQ